MSESAIEVVRLLLFVMVILYIIKSFMPIQGLKDKRLYYEFCHLRRELTFMAITKEARVTSLSFEFFMRVLSDIIHYSDDYKFGSRHFFRSISKDSKSLSQDKFIRKLEKDISKQPEQFQKFIHDVARVLIRAYDKNPIIWMTIRSGLIAYLMYSVFLKLRPKSSITYATAAAKNIRSLCGSCAA